MSQASEKRQQRFAAKLRLFLTLMGSRKYITPEWASALNQIDVVFYDAPKVVTTWREYFNSINRKLELMNEQRIQHAMLDLLHEMAKHLGYPDMRQTDIDRFYSPMQFGNAWAAQAELQTELLRVLKNTAALTTRRKKRSGCAGTSRRRVANARVVRGRA